MIGVYLNLPVRGKHNTCPNLSGYKDPKMAHICREIRVLVNENFIYMHTIATCGLEESRVKDLEKCLDLFETY